MAGSLAGVGPILPGVAGGRIELYTISIPSDGWKVTAFSSGDAQECDALREVFGESERTFFNNTKSFIGHCMGAAGALELAGNLPTFEDRVCHATINLDEIDPACALRGLVANEPRELDKVDYVLNNSFGMLGINSVVIVRRM